MYDNLGDVFFWEYVVRVWMCRGHRIAVTEV
jgi:hypothetical protein